MSEPTVAHDPVNHPSHYMGNGVEAIEVIESYDLDYHLGNAMKYLLRSSKKGNERQDIEKSHWYLRRWIDVEGESGRSPPEVPNAVLIWMTPAEIAEAFQLVGNKAEAVIRILTGAASARDDNDAFVDEIKDAAENVLALLTAEAA
jgi:hypothetical protein